MTDELLNAIKLIKKECVSHHANCSCCPLATQSDDCGVIESGDPKDWKLEKKEVYF